MASCLQSVSFSGGWISANTAKGSSGEAKPFSTGQAIGVRPEDHVWLELSLIREIEHIFVYPEDGLYRVVTIVDGNDAALRDRIYDRELAVMDALPSYTFDFHVLPRLGRNLSELVSSSKRAVYSRR